MILFMTGILSIQDIIISDIHRGLTYLSNDSRLYLLCMGLKVVRDNGNGACFCMPRFHWDCRCLPDTCNMISIIYGEIPPLLSFQDQTPTAAEKDACSCCSASVRCPEPPGRVHRPHPAASCKEMRNGPHP